jgi:serine/threonine protein phosphatase 1
MTDFAAHPDDDDEPDDGALPPSTGGVLAYVVGPVHGQLNLLRDLTAILVTDALAAKPRGRPTIVFLGDYLGAGLGAPEVLAFLIDLKSRPIFEVHALQGRRDRALLNFLDDPSAEAAWMELDGGAILRAYKVPIPAAGSDLEAWTAAADQFRAALPVSHLAFLKSLETLVSIGDYAFVHGGLRPPPAGRGGALGEIQWIRGSPFVQGYRFEQAADAGVRERPSHGGALTGELFALRLKDARQTVFQAVVAG